MSLNAPARDGLIDGLRGLSVGFVVIGHLAFYRTGAASSQSSLKHLIAQDDLHAARWLPALFVRAARDFAAPLAALGVSIFFVISGYLITRALMSEETSRGRISIRAFCVRRACRILPPYLAYVVVVALLRQTEFVALKSQDLLRAATFTCNLSACGWWLAHTWSLAVELQFYLIWPWIFVALSPRLRGPSTIGLALLMPIASALGAPMEGFGCIAVGAAAALSSKLADRIGRLATPVGVWLALVVFIVAPALSPNPIGKGAVDIGLPWLAGLIVFGTLEGRGPLHMAARFAWVQRVGLASYSIYLWQQLATAPQVFEGATTGGGSGYPAIVFALAVSPAALLSFAALEQPFIRIGRRWSAQLTGASHHQRQ